MTCFTFSFSELVFTVGFDLFIRISEIFRLHDVWLLCFLLLDCMILHPYVVELDAFFCGAHVLVLNNFCPVCFLSWKNLHCGGYLILFLANIDNGCNVIRFVSPLFSVSILYIYTLTKMCN